MTIRATRGPVSYRSAAGFDRAVPQLLHAATGTDHGYVVDGDTRLGVDEIAARAGGVQRWLTDAGVGVGDVVAVQLPNWWQTVAAVHAVWGLGAIVNPITPIYRGTELRSILASSRPAAVLVPQHHRGVDYPAMIAEALTGAGHHAAVLPIDVAQDLPESDFRPGSAAADDVAMLMYTSGTTGRAKGVLHTHRTLTYEAASIAQVFGLAGDIVFMPSPLTHITGMLYGIVMPLALAGSVVLLDRWDPLQARETVQRNGCTFTVAATPFLRGLTDSYADADERSTLRTFVCGGADIPAALVERAQVVMGTQVSRTYGSTEMPTLCIVAPTDAGRVRLRTEGRPIGEARARIAPAPPAAGDELSMGELEVTGPELFVGYLDESDTASAFTSDGWFRTGDLASIADNGEISIAGRLKDLIIRGGENVSAKELEDLLATHPSVREVAVVAISDELMGERACAVVVTGDADLTLDRLTAHLDAQQIAKQKYPEALLLTGELPRTVSGKVQKFELREHVAAAARNGLLQRRQGA